MSAPISPAMETPVLSVIVPVHNEADTLQLMFRRLIELPISKEIIFVDDGSTDDSTEQIRRLADQPGVQSLFHSRNLGKGAAIRTALKNAAGAVVVIQDADLEYDSAEIALLISPILNGQADVVFGTRFSRQTWRSPPLRRLANFGLTWLSNCFTGLGLSDMETCYKAMRREVVSTLSIRENRFGVEPELTAKIARGGWRVVEVPISYRPRDHAHGKKIGFRDGLRAVWCILRYSFRD